MSPRTRPATLRVKNALGGLLAAQQGDVSSEVPASNRKGFAGAQARPANVQQADEVAGRLVGTKPVGQACSQVPDYIKDSLSSLLKAKEQGNARESRGEGARGDSEAGTKQVPGYIKDSLASLLASEKTKTGGQHAPSDQEPDRCYEQVLTLQDAEAAAAREASPEARGPSSVSMLSPRITSPRGKHVYV